MVLRVCLVWVCRSVAGRGCLEVTAIIIGLGSYSEVTPLLVQTTRQSLLDDPWGVLVGGTLDPGPLPRTSTLDPAPSNSRPCGRPPDTPYGSSDRKGAVTEDIYRSIGYET